jgi:chemotaxis protein MotB
VNILRENAAIKPENLTAAGRGEYAPVASNETAEGKAKNRRIEVILTPKLDEISRLLNDI